MKRLVMLLLPIFLLLGSGLVTAQTPPATIPVGTIVKLNANCPTPCHLWGTIAADGTVGNSISVPVGQTAQVKTGVPVKNSTGFWYLEVVTTDQKDGFAGYDWLTVQTTTPPPVPPPPPTALVGFACTPSFAPVTFSTFVPAGAQGLKVSLQNSSTNPLTITAATVDAPFSVVGLTLPAIVAPQATLDVMVKFTPTAKGTFTTNVKFTANVAGGSFLMGVTGVSQ